MYESCGMDEIGTRDSRIADDDARSPLLTPSNRDRGCIAFQTMDVDASRNRHQATAG